jgi:hypothetical protein
MYTKHVYNVILPDAKYWWHPTNWQSAVSTIADSELMPDLALTKSMRRCKRDRSLRHGVQAAAFS